MDPVHEQICRHVRTALSRPGSHGFDHVGRVTALCVRIGGAEGADMAVLVPAALLHDIARPLEKELGIPHEKEGARMAEEYLSSIGYDASAIPAIAAAIRTHRFRSAEMPKSLEARVLSDADKLDAVGAVGIARTFMRAGEHGTTIEDGIAHFHEKLLRLKGLMYTETGRQIAEERHVFLQQFLDRLAEEMADRPE
jgi:uncharacterized protein